MTLVKVIRSNLRSDYLDLGKEYEHCTDYAPFEVVEIK